MSDPTREKVIEKARIAMGRRPSGFWHGFFEFVSKLGGTFYLIVGVILPWMAGVALAGLVAIDIWLILGACLLVAGLSAYYAWCQLSKEKAVIEKTMFVLDKLRKACSPEEAAAEQSEQTWFQRLCQSVRRKWEAVNTWAKVGGLLKRSWFMLFDVPKNSVSAGLGFLHAVGILALFAQLLILPSLGLIGVTLIGLAGPVHWMLISVVMLVGVVAFFHRYYAGYKHYWQWNHAETSMNEIFAFEVISGSEIIPREGVGGTDAHVVAHHHGFSHWFGLSFRILSGFLSYTSSTFFVTGMVVFPWILGIPLLTLSQPWILVILSISVAVGVLGGVMAYNNYIHSERTCQYLASNIQPLYAVYDPEHFDQFLSALQGLRYVEYPEDSSGFSTNGTTLSGLEADTLSGPDGTGDDLVTDDEDNAEAAYH